MSLLGGGVVSKRFLEDSFGRRFPYLRLSVTDACNFKCAYCLPNGYQKPSAEESFLNLNEIKNLVRAFSEFGTSKVRLTGGEPTLRRDLLEMIEELRSIPGIEKLALSTNGYRLKSMAHALRKAGLTQLNVSIDTLDVERFTEITGSPLLPEILEGISCALDAGFSSIKVNAVILGGDTLEELSRFQKWIRNLPITVRLIELMPTAANQRTFVKDHLKSNLIQELLREQGWIARDRNQDDGPAIEYTHPDYVGRIGLIAPYSSDFCKNCNRLRVTSRGALQLCLFAESSYSLRSLLQSPDQKEELKEKIASLLQRKEVSHYLPEGRYGNNKTFSAIGG